MERSLPRLLRRKGGRVPVEFRTFFLVLSSDLLATIAAAKMVIAL